MRALALLRTRQKAQEAGQPNAGGVIARTRRLPVISWFAGERRSAGAGAGCGAVGGACCVGGAVVKGFGLASAASVSSFVAVSTPYFVGISIVMMLAWAFWLFRRMGFDVKLFARTIVRHGTVMGVIYGATLAATMGLAAAVGI